MTRALLLNGCSYKKFWNGELQKTTPETKPRPRSIYANIDWQHTRTATENSQAMSSGTVAHATATDRPQTDVPEHIPNTTIVAQANAVEHTREHEWRFTSTENTRTDDEGEVCTVYDRFIGFEFERQSLPEGFQWAPGVIAEQYFLTA